jgi:hypothetical protein
MAIRVLNDWPGRMRDTGWLGTRAAKTRRPITCGRTATTIARTGTIGSARVRRGRRGVAEWSGVCRQMVRHIFAWYRLTKVDNKRSLEVGNKKLLLTVGNDNCSRTHIFIHKRRKYDKIEIDLYDMTMQNLRETAIHV